MKTVKTVMNVFVAPVHRQRLYFEGRFEEWYFQQFDAKLLRSYRVSDHSSRLTSSRGI